MNLKKYIFTILVIASTGNACAMHSSVTVNVDRYPYQPVPITPYPPVTYAPTYYPPTYHPTYNYSYPPTWGYYDDYYWWDNYYDTPASTFVKTCAIMGVLALAFSIIGAIASH